MHTHATSSCCKPLHRPRPTEVNRLWHPMACKLGFKQLSNLPRHPPAKWGEIQQSGKGIMLGLFWTVLGKAWIELWPPQIPTEFLDAQSWDKAKGTVPMLLCSYDEGSPWYKMCLALSRILSARK